MNFWPKNFLISGLSATNTACLVDTDCIGKSCKLNLCGNFGSIKNFIILDLNF